MKKLLYTLIILLGTGFVFSSCEKEEAAGDSSLVGTWICVEQAITKDNGETYTYTDKEAWLDYSNYIIIDYQFTFTKDGYMTGKENYTEREGTPVKYSVRDNIIYIIGVPTYTIISKSKNKLVIGETPEMLELDASFDKALGNPITTKVVATYKKQ